MSKISSNCHVNSTILSMKFKALRVMRWLNWQTDNHCGGKQNKVISCQKKPLQQLFTTSNRQKIACTQRTHWPLPIGLTKTSRIRALLVWGVFCRKKTGRQPDVTWMWRRSLLLKNKTLKQDHPELLNIDPTPSNSSNYLISFDSSLDHAYFISLSSMKWSLEDNWQQWKYSITSIWTMKL